jgi:molybdenum cofactor guanylyltransferase
MENITKLDTASITGLLLAGGLGRRMGGSDKGLLAFDGQPMAGRIFDRLRPQVGRILINANRNLNIWKNYGVPVVSDVIGGFSGPLAGMHAAMTVCTTPWLMTVPCDSPFIPQNLVQQLMDRIVESGADVAVVQAAGRLQPVFALIRCELLSNLEQYLQSGGRKIEAWFNSVHSVVVNFEDSAAFININTPDELSTALRGIVT